MQAELFLLAYNILKYQLRLHANADVMNHEHLLLSDPLGDRIGMFMQNYFSLFARFLNCYWDRSQNVWDSGKPGVVIVAPYSQDVVNQAAYIANNVVKAGLISHIEDWPGVNLVATSATEKSYRIKRPNRFFGEDSGMPEEVTLTLCLPIVKDATPEELAERIETEVKARAEETRAKFKKEGKKFKGRKKILRTSPFSRPKKDLKRSDLVPLLACKDPKLRKKYLKYLMKRRERYAEIRRNLMAGMKNLIFPEGSLAVYLLFGQKREDWQGCIWARLEAEP